VSAWALKPARALGLIALGLLLMGASDDLRRLTPPEVLARLPPPPDKPAFAILSRAPYAELKFHRLFLKNLRPSPAQNEVTLEFSTPVEGPLFEQLKGVLPEWVDAAFTGYDSAVIHARRPVSFSAVPDPDGFTLRIVPQGFAAKPPPQTAYDALPYGPPLYEQDYDRAAFAPLRRDTPRDPLPPRARRAVEAGVGDWRAADRYHAVAMAEGLRGPWRGSLVEPGPTVALNSEWRHSEDDQTVIETGAKAVLPLAGAFALAAEGAMIRATASAVRKLDGTFGSVNLYEGVGSLSLLYNNGATDARVSALYSRAGAGARLSYAGRRLDSESEVSGAYREGYRQTAETIADRAFADSVQLRHAQRIAQGVWGEAALRANRYGVNGDDEVAKTAGFAASLRTIGELAGWATGLSYDVAGEYAFDKHDYPAAGGGTFLPLNIRNREVHAVSASASRPLGSDLWFDAYGGWAVDRYDGNGPLGGLMVRYAAPGGFGISAGISHSEVSARQGENGTITSAGIVIRYTARAAD